MKRKVGESEFNFNMRVIDRNIKIIIFNVIILGALTVISVLRAIF